MAAEGNGAINPYKQYLVERAQLIDAARESARTFDKAVLTFGSAIFGFSIAFLKDVAPSPASDTLKWLGFSWGCFSFGLLAILLSFLFSHRACIYEIEVGEKQLTIQGYQRKRNAWSIATTCCNVVSVTLLFAGLLFWSVFAFDNIGKGATSVNKIQVPPDTRGYVPPRPPAVPTSQPTNPPQPTAPPTSQPNPQK